MAVIITTMRATFILADDKHIQSAIRRRGEPHALSVGWWVILATDYRTPYGWITAGAKGFVDFVDERDGTLWILIEGMEPALLHWENKLVLVPFDTEDLLDVLEFYPQSAQACA